MVRFLFYGVKDTKLIDYHSHFTYVLPNILTSSIPEVQARLLYTAANVGRPWRIESVTSQRVFFLSKNNLKLINDRFA